MTLPLLFKFTLAALLSIWPAAVESKFYPGPKVDAYPMKQDTVVSLDTMDSSTFSQFFQWVSATVSANQQNNDSALPPPPAEINIVI